MSNAIIFMCFGCGRQHLIELPLLMARTLLEKRGWEQTAQGWLCPACADAYRRL